MILLMGVCALITTSAWADGVFATWNMNELAGEGVTFDESITIAQNSVTFTSVCKYADGVTKTANAIGSAQVTASSITVLAQTGANSNADANHSCQVSIQPGTMDYAVSGDTLTLTAQGQSMSLTRAH